ncbi:hypothetical protein GS934_13700 [Rhodococcus hoagii]|nr:hypothetical protein [Prescottella equi]NKZ87943.1 hypothetical protein [Prescottella equi]
MPRGRCSSRTNGTAIGSPVAVAAGQASVQHTFGAAGSHSITAEFSGGPGFASSTAAAQTVPVADPDVRRRCRCLLLVPRRQVCRWTWRDGESVDC